MPFKNNTREKIHTGLSQSRDDSKWFDMLNFRSNAGKTYVVPKRCKLLEIDAGFHTIIHGINGTCYAVGDKQSVLFRGNDNTEFKRLWRVNVHREAGQDDNGEAIQVRGCFTGVVSKQYRIVFTGPEEVVVEEVMEAEPVVPTPVVEETAWWSVQLQDLYTAAPLPLVTVTITDRFNKTVAEKTTDGFGVCFLKLPLGTYTATYSITGYYDIIQTITVTSNNTQGLESMTPIFSRFTGISLRLTAVKTDEVSQTTWYDSTAFYDIYINDLLIKTIDMRRALVSTPPDVYSTDYKTILLTEEESEAINTASGNTGFCTIRAVRIYPTTEALVLKMTLLSRGEIFDYVEDHDLTAAAFTMCIDESGTLM